MAERRLSSLNVKGAIPFTWIDPTKADALQEAKRWPRTYEVEDRGVIRRPGRAVEKRRPYTHPYYWAAFVLIGDPD